MPLQTANIERRKQPGDVAQRVVADRRRHRRVNLSLLGRFMRANKREYPCQLIDISVGGASIQSPILLEPKERVIAYFDHIGGIEGQVQRYFEGGFAMQLKATKRKREKLAAQLTWLINRAELAGIEERRHERVAVGNRSTSLRLEDGTEFVVQMMDISLSGASLAVNARPPIGAQVFVGMQRAVVMRHHEKVIGVQFVDPQGPDELKQFVG